MKVENLQRIIADHALWLKGKGGSKANLQGVDLQGANLQGANLQGANLQGANLRGADLQDANLQWANLRGANLRGADLRGANLRGADLRGANLQDANLRVANLRGANLRGANLRGADLRGANLRMANLQDADLQGANLPDFQICPEEGDFIAWKKLGGGVVAKLLIPNDAKRTSSLIGRKCRAAFVIPIEMYSKGDQPVNYAPSKRGNHLVYVCDKPFYADSYDDDIRVECTHGIHFFMTRKEAEAW